MDEVDRGIIKELTKDAQTPFLRIAEKLDVSPETVRKRYGKMKEKGIIKYCSISIDLSKIGYQGKVFLMITNSPDHNKSTTIEALKKIRNIFVISEVIGDFEIIGIAPVRDLDSIRTLVDEVKRIPSVDRVEIALIDDTAFPINSRFDELFL